MYNQIVKYLAVFFFTLNGIAQNITSTQTTVKKIKAISAQVLNHYKGNKEKQKAAFFLLKHMGLHKSVICEWINTGGEILNYNEFKYTNFEAANSALKVLVKSGAKSNLKVSNDFQQITADLLINNIDDAFKQWKKKPWSKNYTFETFCEYILPYRNRTEPLVNNWRKEYVYSNDDFKHEISNINSPLEVNLAINKRLNNFSFQNQRFYPQPFLSPKQLKYRQQGSCQDMASIAVFAGRANGLAITYDFTPYFAASSSAHSWNTVITNTGKHIPFNGTASLLEIDKLKRLGKVLRITYSNQTESLANKIDVNYIPKGSLRKKNLKDVTEEYVKTTNFKVNFDKLPPQNISYLLVYNKGFWKPLWWGTVNKKREAVFKNMGVNIVYLPATLKTKTTANTKNELELYPHPVLIDINGNKKVLKPNYKQRHSCELSRLNEVKLENNDFNTVEFTENKSFTLSYWDNGWKKQGLYTVKNQKINLSGLPHNCLFQLLPLHPDGFERIFTINPQTCQISWF